MQGKRPIERKILRMRQRTVGKEEKNQSHKGRQIIIERKGERERERKTDG